MKKILLIGQLSEIIRSINDGLNNEFQIQLCSEDVDTIRSMAKIVKPDLVIFCQVGVEDLDEEFFTWATLECKEVPVLVISTQEGWRDIERYCRSNQFSHLLRPVTIHAISKECHRMLEMNVLLQNTAEIAATGAKLSQRKKILLVDDSAMFLRTAEEMLDGDYKVHTASSGEEALIMIPQVSPDLVLLDYEMGGLSGKETFEKMLEKGMGDIPVIFLTSVAKRDRVFDVLEKKPAGYILKPVSKDSLLGEISKVLNYV